MRLPVLSFLSALALGAVPVAAQDAMASHDKMASHDQMASSAAKASAADMRKAKACNAMPHDKMAKDAGCTRLFQAHPDMMKHDDMMSSGH